MPQILNLSPFSYVILGDVNRDGSARNDLVFIPKNASDINLVDITDANNNVTVSRELQWQQLNAFIEGDPYLSKNRGKFAERNGARTPWNHTIDMNLAFENTFGTKGRLQVSLDIFNVANLINRNLGKQYFVPNLENSSFSLLNFVRIENNQPIYQFNNPQGKPWQIDTVASRWQAQLGVKYSF